MKRAISLLLIFSLLILSGNLYAKKKGATLVIQKTDRRQVKGELITVKKDSLLLKDSQSGAVVTVEVGNIRAITIVKKSKVMLGGGLGFLTGGLTVFLIGTITDPEESGANLAFGALGGILGFFVGLVVGSFFGNDKTIQIEGKSDSEIKDILEDLRKKARIPNFQ